MENDLALLNEKVDGLVAYFEEQQKRQQAFDELKDDLIPIANQMIKISIDELAEIGTEFSGEDLLFLLKRVLRDTKLLIKTLNHLEALMGMADEINILGKQIFSSTVEKLDEFERKGYFRFANQSIKLMDRVVEEFDEAGMDQLADNIGPMMKTAKKITQPEVIGLADRALDALMQNEQDQNPPSMMQILGKMRDPYVRKGLSKMLSLLEAVGAG